MTATAAIPAATAPENYGYRGSGTRVFQIGAMAPDQILSVVQEGNATPSLGS